MDSHHHFIIFKPWGYHSQFILAGNKKKLLLGSLHDFPDGTMSIGRLDKPSEGLLLLTTDGKMSQAVRSKKVVKEYYVQVDGEITEEALTKLRNGVEIMVEKELYMTRPSKTHVMDRIPNLPLRAKPIRDDRHGPSTWISISIVEGKNRQIRKMTAEVGFPTLRLVRFRIGEITIEDMYAGEVREVDLMKYF
ncbi:MAG TPA: pseudouridine synthase [Saprospirales bacterium]|nr:pseudouridine synthase [Saprospiraceae bacterium]HCV51712.1 pseudouridine synthase [Saprospirales bacterium]MDA9332739.1 pseudouridine synthase [Saprospiraceae bacterium]MDA9358418.1 pseudouridine synthase [Saprospiraceae bacterium]MDA9866287.1 pseudouridine synthase [Saprospiraceae bacterium]